MTLFNFPLHLHLCFHLRLRFQSPSQPEQDILIKGMMTMVSVRGTPLDSTPYRILLVTAAPHHPRREIVRCDLSAGIAGTTRRYRGIAVSAREVHGLDQSHTDVGFPRIGPPDRGRRQDLKGVVRTKHQTSIIRTPLRNETTEYIYERVSGVESPVDIFSIASMFQGFCQVFEKMAGCQVRGSDLVEVLLSKRIAGCNVYINYNRLQPPSGS